MAGKTPLGDLDAYARDRGKDSKKIKAGCVLKEITLMIY